MRCKAFTRSVKVFKFLIFFQEEAKFYQCEEDVFSSAGRQDVLS